MLALSRSDSREPYLILERHPILGPKFNNHIPAPRFLLVSDLNDNTSNHAKSILNVILPHYAANFVCVLGYLFTPVGSKCPSVATCYLMPYFRPPSSHAVNSRPDSAFGVVLQPQLNTPSHPPNIKTSSRQHLRQPIFGHRKKLSSQMLLSEVLSCAKSLSSSEAKEEDAPEQACPEPCRVGEVGKRDISSLTSLALMCYNIPMQKDSANLARISMMAIVGTHTFLCLRKMENGVKKVSF